MSEIDACHSVKSGRLKMDTKFTLSTQSEAPTDAQTAPEVTTTEVVTEVPTTTVPGVEIQADSRIAVGVARSDVVEVRIVDTDIVLILADGRRIYIRDGAVQAVVDPNFVVEFTDGVEEAGQSLLQGAGSSDIGRVALSGPLGGQEETVVVVQVPVASPVPPEVAEAANAAGGASGSGPTGAVTRPWQTWALIGAPLIGGLAGGGSSSSSSFSVLPSPTVFGLGIGNVISTSSLAQSNNVVAFTGTAQANSVITAKWGDAAVKEATADEAGRWQIEYAAAEIPSDGPVVTFSATATLNGVVSEAGTRDLVVDTTGPSVAINTISNDGVVGPSERAGGVEVTGTTEAGASVRVTWGGTTKVVTANAQGQWSANFANADIPTAGTYTVTAVGADAYGNVSPSTASSSVIVSPSITVSGTITAGPVVAGHGLVVDLYDGAGNLLSAAVTVSSTGVFSASGLSVDINGVIIARVRDTNTAPDYSDEATGVATDITMSLASAAVVTGANVQLNINPLTTIAAVLANISTDTATVPTATAAAVASNLTNVANAFGIVTTAAEPLSAITPIATNSSAFNPNDTSVAAKVGVALAALSGGDLINGGNSTTTISTIASSISSGALNSTGLDLVVRGAAVADARTTGSLTTLVGNQLSTSVSTGAVTVTIDTISGDGTISSADRAALGGVLLTGTVSQGATSVKVLVGTVTLDAVISGATWSVAANATTLNTMGDTGVKTIRVTATAGDATATASRPVLYDVTPPSVPTIDAVESDNRVNLAEIADGVVVSGFAAANDRVVVTWGGLSREVVAASDGKWSMSLSSAEVPVDGKEVNLVATAFDAAGNSSFATVQTVIDRVAPNSLTINNVSEGNFLGPNAAGGSVTITGKAEAGATVTVTWPGGTVPKTAITNVDGDWMVRFLPSEVPNRTVGGNPFIQDGNYTITAQEIDPAGNKGQDRSINVTVDATGPIAPTFSVNASGRVNQVNFQDSNSSVTVTGTTEGGAKVRVVWEGIIKDTVANATGTWTVTYNSNEIVPILNSVTGNTTSISATATDTAGNLGAVASISVRHDLVSTTPMINTVSGDNRVNAAEEAAGFTVTGTAEAGAIVEVKIANATKTVNAISSGAWSAYFVSADGILDGAQTVSVKATDAFGNISATATQVVTFDSIVAAPGFDLADASDSSRVGYSAGTTDNITNATSQTFNLTGEAGATVQVRNGTTVLATTVLGSDGKGSATVTLGAGTYNNLTAVQTDLAGNVSTSTLHPVVVIDTSSDAPTLTTATSVGTDGYLNANEAANGFTVTGKAENNSRVSVTILGQTVTVDANASGDWTAQFTKSNIDAMSPSLAEGTITYSAVSTDAAGNVSASASSTFEVKTTVAAPTLDFAETSEDGLSNSDDLTSRTSVTFNVTGEAGAVVKLYNGATEIGVSEPLDANGNGTVTATLTAASGQTTTFASITAKQTDRYGNESAASAAHASITVDRVAPGAPTGLDLTDDTDTFGSHMTGGFLDNNTKEQLIAFNVVGENGALVTVFEDKDGDGILDDSEAIGSATIVDGKAIVTATRILAEGSYSNIKAVQVDAAGNVSVASSAHAVIHIDRVSTLPTINVVSADGIVNSTEKAAGFAVSGTAEAGARVVVSLDSGASAEVTANDGTWSVSFTATQIGSLEGSRTVSAIATDMAGNVSVAATRTFIVDTVAPTAPTVDLVAADDTKGGSVGTDSDNVTNKSQVQITVTAAEANGTVVLYNGTTEIGRQTLSGGATQHTFTFDSAVLQGAQGTFNLRAEQIDVAGNSGTQSPALVVVVDRVVAAPTITGLDSTTDSGTIGDNITGVQRPKFNVTGEVGARVALIQVDADGNEIAEVGSTILAAATGTIEVNNNLSPGETGQTTYRFKVKQTDAAGNDSALSTATTSIVVDDSLIAPELVWIGGAANDSGTSDSDRITNVLAPTITVTGKAGSTVRIFNTTGSPSFTSNLHIAEVTIPLSGSKTVELQLNLNANQAYNLVALQRSTSNTVSNASSALQVTTDTTVSALTVAMGASDANDVSGILYARSETPKFTISGGEVGASVTLKSGADTVGTAIVGSDGTATITASSGKFANGQTYTSISATQTDKAGNTSTVSNLAKSLVIDTTVAAPTLTLAASSDSGFSNSDGKTNNKKPTFTLTGETGSEFIVFRDTDGDDAYDVGETILVRGTGTSLSPSADLADGTYSDIKAVQIDRAGNQSAAVKLKSSANADISLEVETSRPSNTPTLVLKSSSDTAGTQIGTTSDNITKDTKLTFEVTGESGARAFLWVDADNSGTINGAETDLGNTTLTGTSGEIVVDFATLPAVGTTANGVTTVKNLRIRQQDVFGNSGTVVSTVLGGTQGLIIDRNAIATPTISLVNDTGTAADNVTSATSLTFSVTGRSLSHLRLIDLSSGAAAVATLGGTRGGTDTKADFSIDLATLVPGLTDGTRTIRVVSTDDVGNEALADISVTIDRLSIAPTIVLMNGSVTDADGVTNSNPVRFKVDGEAGSNIIVYNEVNGTAGYQAGVDTLLGSATVAGARNANASTNVDLSNIAEGTKWDNVRVQQTDSVGNVTIGSHSGSVVIDRTAPTIGLSFHGTDSGTQGDGITNDSTPTFRVSTEGGARVALYRDTNLNGVLDAGDFVFGTASTGATTLVTATNLANGSLFTTVSGSGAQSIDFTPATLADGSKIENLRVQAIDAAGNLRDSNFGSTNPTAGERVIVSIDTVASRAVLASITNDSGTPADFFTNDTTLDLNFTGDVGSVVKVYLSKSDMTLEDPGDTLLGTVTIGSDGKGMISNVEFSKQLTFSNGRAQTASVINGSNGQTNILLVRTEDVAGNIVLGNISGTAISGSGNGRITFDSVMAAAPVVTTVTLTDTGSSASDGITGATQVTLAVQNKDYFLDEPGYTEIWADTNNDGTADKKIAEFVTAKRADTVNITVSTTAVTANATEPSHNTDPTRLATAALTEGNYKLWVKHTDFMGNSVNTVGGVTNASGFAELKNGSNQVQFTIDRSIAVPTVALATGHDTGTASDGITNRGITGTPLTFEVSGEIGATVTLIADEKIGTGAVTSGKTIGTGTIGANGKASIDVAYANTVFTAELTNLRAVATDVAGNTATSNMQNYIIDRAMTTTQQPVLGAASDTGLSNSDQITNAATLNFTFGGEGAASFEVFNGSTSLGVTGTVSGVRNGSGTGSFSLAGLAEGTHSISVRAVDIVGNTSNGAARTVIVDRTAASSGTLSLNSASDSGTKGDSITNVNGNATFTVTTEGASTVRLLDGVTVLGSVTMGGTRGTNTTGTLTADLSKLGDGTPNLTLEVTDVAGNVANFNVTGSLIIDRTAAQPTITGISNDTGTVDLSTDRRSVVVTGTADAGATVELLRDGSVIQTVTANSQGQWVSSSVSLSALALGSTASFTARTTDVAGNISTPSAAAVVTRNTDTSVSNQIQVLNAASLGAFGFTIRGDQNGAAGNGDRLGTSVSGIGDFNQDGVADFVVSASFAERAGQSTAANHGELYVIYGRRDGQWGSLGGGQRVLSIGQITESVGMVVSGNVTSSQFSSVAAVDYNNDGFVDLAFGTSNSSLAGGGYVLLGKQFQSGGPNPFGAAAGDGIVTVVGPTSTASLGSFDLAVSGGTGGDSLGQIVAVLDINGDGKQDVAYSMSGADRGSVTNNGEVVVVYGGTSSATTISATSITPSQGFVINYGNTSNGAFLGNSLGVLDFNNDGKADLAIGAPLKSFSGPPLLTQAGEVVVVFGRTTTGATPETLWGVQSGGRQVLDLSTDSNQFVTFTGAGTTHNVGATLQGIGDINGDGIGELLIGAPGAAGGAGLVYVVYGTNDLSTLGGTVSGNRRTVSLGSLTAAQGFAIQGISAGENFARNVSSAGDVNGDGLADFIITTLSADNGATDTGSAYVILGRPSVTGGGTWSPPDNATNVLNLSTLSRSDGFRIDGGFAGDAIGTSASRAGDVNGDGYDDIIIGASFADQGRTDSTTSAGAPAGEAYVIFGRADFGGLVRTGTSAADTLLGGDRGDVFTGLGGADVIRGFAGDDRISVSDLNWSFIDGGSGTDTLVLDGAGLNMSLASYSGTRLTGVERLDIHGTGANSLTLTRASVGLLSDTSDRLVINRGSDDVLNIGGFNQVAETSTRFIGSFEYDVHRSSGTEELWIQKQASGTINWS